MLRYKRWLLARVFILNLDSRYIIQAEINTPKQTIARSLLYRSAALLRSRKIFDIFLTNGFAMIFLRDSRYQLPKLIKYSAIV